MSPAFATALVGLLVLAAAVWVGGYIAIVPVGDLRQRCRRAPDSRLAGGRSHDEVDDDRSMVGSSF